MLVGHISDLHLGRRSPGDELGAERLNSFRQAITTLAGLHPDVILVAGDTFENPHVDEAVIEEAARTLARARNEKGDPLTVIVIPGNHDPADADRLWATFRKSLGSPCAVHLALEPEVIELFEGKLLVEAYPCPTRYSAAPPWQKRLTVSARAGKAVRIVVAHGTLQGGPVPEGETDAYPFSQADVEGLGAAYVALGHFHGVYPPWTSGDDSERSYCYSGTHETDQFGSDSGYALMVEVTEGRPTRLRRHRVGKRQWRSVDLAGPADLVKIDRLRQEIDASNDPARFVVRLKIATGSDWPAGDIDRMDRLEGALRACGVQVERRGEVQPRLDVAGLDLLGLPSGAVKEALLCLQGELGQNPDDSRRQVLAAAIVLGHQKIREAIEP